MTPTRLNRRQFLKQLTTSLAATTLGPAALNTVSGNNNPAKKPNIIFFLVDDLGWMDTTTYGSTYYQTPNVERLAARSMRFTDAYAANPLCSPTRASIMTGKYPARLHLTAPAGHLPKSDSPLLPEQGPPYKKMLIPRSKRYLPLEERTIAEALHETGYKTGFIGKWHLGYDEKYWPEYQGFDLNVGGGRWPGPPSYFAPYHISKLPDGPKGEYITDRLTNEALNFIDKNRNDPFFLCFWHYAVHAPFQAKENLRKAFLDKRDPRSAQHNPVMAAMIKSMDESLGRLLDKLDRLSLAENTIIIFFSDNGGNMYSRVAADGTMYPAQAPQGRRPTNNAPLRSGKGSIYEGGVRVPMLVCWPGTVKNPCICTEPVNSIDFYPTLLDMAGLKPKPGKTLDGLSLLPLLKKTGSLHREALFCHFPHNVPAVPCQAATSVRQGPWKLIRFYDLNENFPNQYELYNLRDDIGEINNLAKEMPEKVRQLDALIDRHLKAVNAIVPKPNPAYNPDALTNLLGWTPSGQCAILKTNDALRVKSAGNDPYITNNSIEPAAGKLQLNFRTRSTTRGSTRLLWLTQAQPNYKIPHNLAKPYSIKHDGKWHEITINFETDSPLTMLRLDPGTAPGTIDFDYIRLCTQTGQTIQTWDFK